MGFFSDSGLGSPPRSNEFEIAIFGPGTGECILMHLGRGEWFVIDSCRFPNSSAPVAIDYLEALNIDPHTAIRRILATHWHDDHVAGLAEIVRRCPNASLIISAALQSAQFFQLVYEVDACNKLVKANSTASEFADILDSIAARGERTALAPAMYASDGSMLYQGGFDGAVSVQALSPSAATFTNTLVDLAATLCTTATTRRFRRMAPNHLSVAVQVTAGPVELLLKADLEDSSSSQFGWNAVLQSPFRPQRRNHVVKVGHHGSRNADNDEVWQKMISDNPVCVVTPFSKLAIPLPGDSDIARMSTRTNRLFITTWPPTSKPQRRRGVDRMISAATRFRSIPSRRPGFVRVRFGFEDCSNDPLVELFGSARQL